MTAIEQYRTIKLFAREAGKPCMTWNEWCNARVLYNIFIQPCNT